MTNLLLQFLSATVVISPFLFPVAGMAKCDLEKIFISLDAKDKPVVEILKDIEKQAKYTIETQGNNKPLTNNKSIKLDQTPLDLSINRLIAGLDYSMVCNSDKKVITLILLDKNGSPASVSTQTQKNTDGTPTNSMEGVAAAAQLYENNKKQSSASRQESTDTPQQESEEMKGFAAASQIYEDNKKRAASSKQKTTDIPQQEPQEMKGFAAAAQIYENKKKQPSAPKQESTDAPQQEPQGMKGFAAAAQVYENNKANGRIK